MGRPQPRPHRSGRLVWIAGALAGASAAAAALIVAGPIGWTPAPVDPSATPASPVSPPAGPASSGRSAAELSEALQGSIAPPPASPGPADRAARKARADGPIAWDTLTQSCLADVGRSSPGEALRLLESTGFVPQGAEARRQLGFDWDQAVRLSLEPRGGGKPVGIECYFLKGSLVGKGRG